MTYHQTEYDDLLELAWKLPDKAQLLLRQGCRHAERSSLINEPEAEVFGPALLERPFDFYGRPSPWQNSSAGDPISTCAARILSHVGPLSLCKVYPNASITRLIPGCVWSP